MRKSERTAPSLRDVAERAGVSVATASRVIGGTYPVAVATRKKVNSAIRDLGYDVGRTRTDPPAPVIAMIAGDLRAPLVHFIAAGVEDAAAAARRVPIIATAANDPEREERFLRVLTQQRSLEAVIYVGGVSDTPAYRTRLAKHAKVLADADALTVLCGRPPVPGVDALVVEFDNPGSAFALVSHVISRGHRSIAHVGSLPGYTTAEARLDGYRAALAAHGLPHDPSLEVFRGVNQQGGYLAALELLRDRPEVTALVCQSDSTAAGAMAAARDLGRSIPGDVSIAGFDDIPLAENLSPSLTTVHVPHEQLGRAAVQLVLARPPVGSARRHNLIGGHVVMRDSVGRPRSPAP